MSHLVLVSRRWAASFPTLAYFCIGRPWKVDYISVLLMIWRTSRATTCLHFHSTFWSAGDKLRWCGNTLRETITARLINEIPGKYGWVLFIQAAINGVPAIAGCCNCVAMMFASVPIDFCADEFYNLDYKHEPWVYFAYLCTHAWAKVNQQDTRQNERCMIDICHIFEHQNCLLHTVYWPWLSCGFWTFVGTSGQWRKHLVPQILQKGH